MDKVSRIKYVSEVQEYLTDNKNPSSDSDYFTHIYELFQYLQRQLLIHRPENPLDFLINKLGKKEPCRVFIVGTPGSQAGVIAKELGEHFLFDHISLGKILEKEAEKSTDLGKAVMKIKDYRFVDDKIAIQAVKMKIPHGSEISHSYLLQGYPKNKIQSLQLQKLGIIPDKFILLDVEEEVALNYIKERLIKNGTPLMGDELDAAARVSLEEYYSNIEGVKQCFKGFLYEKKISPDSIKETVDELKRMIQVKLNSPK